MGSVRWTFQGNPGARRFFWIFSYPHSCFHMQQEFKISASFLCKVHRLLHLPQSREPGPRIALPAANPDFPVDRSERRQTGMLQEKWSHVNSYGDSPAAHTWDRLNRDSHTDIPITQVTHSHGQTIGNVRRARNAGTNNCSVLVAPIDQCWVASAVCSYPRLPELVVFCQPS